MDEDDDGEFLVKQSTEKIVKVLQDTCGGTGVRYSNIDVLSNYQHQTGVCFGVSIKGSPGWDTGGWSSSPLCWKE